MDQANEFEGFLERVRSLLGPNPPAVGAGEIEAILELARVAARLRAPGRPGHHLPGRPGPGRGRPRGPRGVPGRPGGPAGGRRLGLGRGDPEVAPDLVLDLAHRPAGVDRQHDLLGPEQVQHGPGLGVVVAQPGPDRLGRVVGPGHQPPAAHVADVGHGRAEEMRL